MLGIINKEKCFHMQIWMVEEQSLIWHVFIGLRLCARPWLSLRDEVTNRIANSFSSAFILVPDAYNCPLTCPVGYLIDISNITYTKHYSWFAPTGILKFTELLQSTHWTFIIYLPPFFIPIQSIGKYCGHPKSTWNSYTSPSFYRPTWVLKTSIYSFG